MKCKTVSSWSCETVFEAERSWKSCVKCETVSSWSCETVFEAENGLLETDYDVEKSLNQAVKKVKNSWKSDFI